VPREQIEEWQQKAEREFTLAEDDKKVLEYLQSLGPGDMPADEREMFIRSFQRYQAKHWTAASEYMFRVLVTPVGPSPQPKPEEHLLHVDLQSVFTRNESPTGQPAYNSLDSQVGLVFKDKALFTGEDLQGKSAWLEHHKWLEIALGHEPAAAGTLSIHYRDPGDADQQNAGGLTTHPQLSVQGDIFDVTLKPWIGGEYRDLLEFKSTLAFQYDFLANQLQGQLQFGLELHITKDEWSAIFQYQKPLLLGGWRPSDWHEQPPSYGIGIVRHY
jgi:hypothetical protein